MTRINPEIGWFLIVKVPTFDICEVIGGNYEYIYKSSYRVSHLLNNTWICRYLCPQKVVFENVIEFKRNFSHLIKYFDIKPVLKKIENPQDQGLVEWVHQVILNMLVTKYLDNNVFEYIYPWGETLVSIEWDMRES